MPDRDAPWVYDIQIPGLLEHQQDRLVYLMNQAGIAARHAFKPISAQPEYCFSPRYREDYVLNAAKLSREVIYLPVSETMMGTDVENICGVFNQIVKEIL